MDDKSAQRQKAHETLINIARLSKELHNKLSTLNFSSQGVSVRARLDRIFVASKSILEKSLDNASDATLDPRLKVWLHSEEPKWCLYTLSDMDKLIGTGLGGRTWRSRFNNVLAHSLYSEGRIDEAIKLFNDRRRIFHFLLTSDVWNYETSHRLQPWMGVGAVQTAANGAPREEPENEKIDPGKLDSVVKWLDGYNCNKRHEYVASLCQPDTCTWLPGTDRYQVWRDSDNSFLWLQGKPGAGKTVLAASVIGRIKKTLQEGECVVFFYCDFGEEQTRSAAAVMRSILSQLLHKLRDGTGQDLIQLVDDMINERVEDTLILTQARRMTPFVSRAARQFSRQPFVIVDALDECQDIEDLLHALRELVGSGMHLFVTSRPLQIIKDKFHDLPFISMNKMTKEVSTDIRLHVTKEVDSDRRLRILEEELKKEILTTLRDKADGMFRWVQCQINALRKCSTARMIRSTLLSLPNGLDETYERILCAIEPESSMEARRALDWLVVALRPLRLDEILEALSIDLERRRLDRGISPVHGPALLDALGSLVVHDEESNIIKLSHFSVKEYLVGMSSHMSLSMYCINVQMAHTQVVLLCMCYIAAVLEHQALSQTKTSLQVSSDRQTNIISVLSKSHCLLRYALHHGFRHLQSIGSVNHVVIDGMIALRLDIKQHPAEWQLICPLVTLPSPFPSGRCPAPQHDFIVCILISLLPEQFLRAFLRQASFKAFDGTNPLIYAIYFGKIGHARILLSRGISQVNNTGLDVENPHQILPLELAFRCRHHSLFDLFLLDWEATVPLRLFSCVFYEKHLYFNIHDATKLLRLDEFAEWASDGQHGPLLRALHSDWPLVVKSQSKKVVATILRRLAQVGCNLSGPDSLEFVLGVTLDVVFNESLPALLDLCSLGVPIPSRVLSIGTIQGKKLIKELALRNLDVNAIMAQGDTVLYDAFGGCRHGISCWASDCNPCSVFLRALTFRDYVPQPINVLFVGRKGAGKSSLINMVMGIPDDSPGAAKLINGSKSQITCYATYLENLPIQIWDTPGFDRTLDDCHLRDKVNEWLLQVSSSHALKTNSLTVQVICCVNAEDIADSAAWQQFQAIYEECRRLGADLMVLINQLSTSSPGDWEVRCRDQLAGLGVSEDLVLLKGIRNHQGVSSPKYKSDSRVLCQLMQERAKSLGNPSRLRPLASYSAQELGQCRWVTSHSETGPNVCNQIVCKEDISEHLTRCHGLSRSSKSSCRWEGCNFEGDMRGEQIIKHVREEHLHIKFSLTNVIAPFVALLLVTIAICLRLGRGRKHSA